jgi:hypothetical protein
VKQAYQKLESEKRRNLAINCSQRTHNIWACLRGFENMHFSMEERVVRGGSQPRGSNSLTSNYFIPLRASFHPRPTLRYPRQADPLWAPDRCSTTWELRTRAHSRPACCSPFRRHSCRLVFIRAVSRLPVAGISFATVLRNCDRCTGGHGVLTVSLHVPPIRQALSSSDRSPPVRDRSTVPPLRRSG